MMMKLRPEQRSSTNQVQGIKKSWSVQTKMNVQGMLDIEAELQSILHPFKIVSRENILKHKNVVDIYSDDIQIRYKWTWG